jgi:ribonuclease HI
MELTALIEAYKYLPRDTEIEVFTDSNLCVQTVNQWAANWEKRGWRRKDGEIANLELVKTLYQAQKDRPGVRLKWIKAHNGWLWNEYADSLSTAWTRDEV